MLVRGSVALTATVFCAAEFMPVSLLRYISDGLQVSEGTAGIVVAAPGILAAIAAPTLTVAVGRHDRRLVLWALVAPQAGFQVRPRRPVRLSAQLSADTAAMFFFLCNSLKSN
jgi:predicted MFS family arabinose efflux permease